ncbi:MAG: Glutathione ABC transport system permease protein GsiC [Thermacetogenium phaeum]|uniref:Glutathione ABC transport system permease protein GsiC n=1 Tax=Thermacetogenium phaeum TaxID=85874 RepID=A0A101FGV1_9THEO|nr:MAG: Glutathione ABC transport system permease protein GsiC [Thermacetogenium phaeum]
MKKAGSGASYLIAFFLIITINFVLPRLMPGDPLMAIYGEEALIAMTPELKAELTQRFSLDRPLGEQFISYLLALLRGDLGYSYYYNAPVLEVIAGSLPWTLLLVGLAVLASSILGIVLGIESGYRRGRPLDKVFLAGLMSFSGLPDFFVGTLLLLLFGVALGVMPLAGAVTPYAGKTGLELIFDVLHHLALPLFALVLVRLAGTYLLTRNTMITTLGEAFILTAKAKGCRERVIRYRHAGKNSLLPVVTATGLQLAHSVTGALFIEIIFSYPGVGSILYNSLLTRDYPLMQGILLVTTVMILAANYLVDLLYARIDPRVSQAH